LLLFKDSSNEDDDLDEDMEIKGIKVGGIKKGKF
jgi:hypothetical protein